MNATRCAECGALYADPSESCAARFDALIALDHSRQEPWGSRHGLAFAVFALQHPERFTPATRAHSHELLTRVYARGEPLERVVQEVRRRTAAHEAASLGAAPAEHRPFATTIADLGEFDAATYAAQLDEWCRATLAAFKDPGAR